MTSRNSATRPRRGDEVASVDGKIGAGDRRSELDQAPRDAVCVLARASKLTIPSCTSVFSRLKQVLGFLFASRHLFLHRE